MYEVEVFVKLSYGEIYVGSRWFDELSDAQEWARGILITGEASKADVYAR